ncbi:MAG: DUF4097 domain-containing protein [Clostridia bacterium]|nr:DUF4097 domain-containing protein [Clostridia bacterium]
MQGFVKTIIAGAVILGLGIAVLIIALGASGWNVDAAFGNSDFEMKTYSSSNKVETLEIEFYAGTLDIAFYDGEEVKIEYPENKKYSASVEEHDGVLSISTGKRHWYDWISWGLVKFPVTTIRLPADSKVNLDLHLNAGTVKIADGEYGNTEIYINAGTIEAGEINCNELKVELNAGFISAQKAACNNFSIKMNAGSADINRIYCDNIYTKINAGSMDLEIAGAEKEYGISIKKNAGSCNKSNREGTDPDKKISGEINAGSLDINFTD